MIRPIAPTHSVLRAITEGEPVSISKFLSRARDTDTFVSEDEARGLVEKSVFTAVEESFTASNVPADTLAHWAWLHKMGREPHIDAVLHLLQEFQDDGNRFHLVQAIEVLTHLKSL